MACEALGRRESTDFCQGAFVFTLFFFFFVPLMAQNCDFTDPDAQGQRIANK